MWLTKLFITVECKPTNQMNSPFLETSMQKYCLYEFPALYEYVIRKAGD